MDKTTMLIHANELRVRLEDLLDAPPPVDLEVEDFAGSLMIENDDVYRPVVVGRDVVMALFRCRFERTPRAFWALGEGVAWTTEWDGKRFLWTPYVGPGSPLADS